MIGQKELRDKIGSQAVGENGHKLGKITQIYENDQTGRPEFITVQSGMFGSREAPVPVAGATMDGDRVQVPFGRDRVKHAPQVDGDGQISPSQQDALYDHYGMPHTGAPERAGHDGGKHSAERNRADMAGRDTAGRDTAGMDTAGMDTAGRTTADRGTAGDRDTGLGSDRGAMTRSEEEMHVDTTRRETGRARLRKYVVTEQQEQTVPVSHEEVRVEREPITEANRDEAYSGPELNEDEHEVVLHEEQPTVEKRTVPKERVRLDTDEVRGQETVADEVRKERIDIDDDKRHGGRH